jgi:EEF1A lysine methyltransferase 1
LTITRRLSGSTLAALQEFYAERDSQTKQVDELKAAVEGNEQLSMTMFSEDWNASQFWVLSNTLSWNSYLTAAVQ